MTPTEIQYAALKELGTISVNDVAPPAELGVAVREKYNSLHGMLLNAGLVNWALTENVPVRAEQAVIWMLAYLCSTSEKFGSVPEKKAELMALGSIGNPVASTAERMLRKLIARPYVSQQAQAYYY